MTLNALTEACNKSGTAIRLRALLQPIGGPGDKIFPPTHLNGEYADETRMIPDPSGNFRPCHAVLIDSVQSQANRLEACLSSPIADNLQMPRLVLTLDGRGVTSLDAPHRVYDAFFHDAILDGQPFRQSKLGQSLVNARVSDATALFRYAPNALLFGAWDSRSNSLQGARFSRALVSEIVALDAEIGRRTKSRICPVGIRSTEIYKGATEPYTFDADKAEKDSRGNPLKLEVTKVGHSNIPPTIESGGVTAREIIQTAVISLTQLRQLQFGDQEASNSARTVLAALGLYALVSQIQTGYALRSRCQLQLAAYPHFQLLGSMPDEIKQFSLTLEDAKALLTDALGKLPKQLAWETTPTVLQPSDRLLTLIARSAAAAAN